MGKEWDKFKEVGHWDGNRGYESHKDAYGRIQGKCPAKYKTNGDNSNFQQFTFKWATELYRVMKPGAHIAVFGGTRTYHRMACAVEDAGFEVRDMLAWIYGSGFPKSLDISKSLDKMNGEEREVVGESNRHGGGSSQIFQERGNNPLSAPATEEAIQWNGWGTGLKPAHEPILLARKPISEGSIAANVLKWGTGGVNVDGCRISTDENIGRRCGKVQFLNQIENDGDLITTKHQQGRFPANVLLGCCCGEEELVEGAAKSGGGEKVATDKGITSFKTSHKPFHYDDKNGNGKCRIHTNPACVCGMLDEQSGDLNGEIGRANGRPREEKIGMFNLKPPITETSLRDTGGASRVFYQAKASQAERWFYCTICKEAFQMAKRDKHTHGAAEEAKYQFLEFHPTQKPEALIAYLMRFLTPPGGAVVDPFLGSGTAIIAAEREGFNCVGIDSKREYCEVAHHRGKAELVQQKIVGVPSRVEGKGF